MHGWYVVWLQKERGFLAHHSDGNWYPTTDFWKATFYNSLVQAILAVSIAGLKPITASYLKVEE